MGRATGQTTDQTVQLGRRDSGRPSATEMKQLLARVTELRDACTEVWAADTSASGEEWSKDNPSLGQCAVTSLLVQDFCGGELLRTTIQGVSHYFNRLPDGTEIDLTRQQFGDNQELDVPAEPRDRDYVLSYGPTAERYARLRERVLDQLGIAAIDEREQTVLQAVKEAQGKTAVVDLTWVVEGARLSGSVCERLLTKLRKAGLVESVAVGKSRSWRPTSAGELALAAYTA